ncbi:MAG: MFS transporter [Sedimentisphaerales bacterium]|nr:MFS transporter [Sedimentisphaerales bacterium]
MNQVAEMSSQSFLGRRARLVVLCAAFAGLLFDGIELGLMPIASLSVTQSLLGDRFTDALAGDWFARFTAGLMLGAAVGGIVFGALGDRVGRTRAMGVSILFYSVFSGAGFLVGSLEQMLALRFFVGLGIGGMWPNGVSLVSECWPNVSRPMVAGIVGAGLNTGILLLSQIARIWHITPDSWRWLFGWSAVPGLLGVVALCFVPESPRWLSTRTGTARRAAAPLRELFRPPLLRLTLLGIVLGSIPMIGAWAASKWMIPWADKIGGAAQPGYKALAQGFWALGAVLGSFFGAQLAGLLGRRLSYFLISLGSTALTCGLFLFTAPLQPAFLPMAFVQGFVATLFFGWLPLYLPELFPTKVRATGSGIAYNVGRFATAGGVFAAGVLATWFGGDFARVGAVMGLVYALGMVAIWWAPETSNKDLPD